MKECPRCGICRDDEEEVCPEDGAVLAPTVAGSRLIHGKYLLLRRLGQRVMGRSYRARHSNPSMNLDRDFALKLVQHAHHRHDELLELFRREAKALGRLKHPGVVLVTDADIDPRGGGTPYIVTELLEGESLLEYLRRRGLPSLDEALPILGDLASALDYLHGSGILHRDLKPANVFVVDTPEGPKAKLIDFGLASLHEGRVPVADAAADTAPPSEAIPPPTPASAPAVAWDPSTPTRSFASEDLAMAARAQREGGGAGRAVASTAAGTPHYMAPEIIRHGSYTQASDVYGFGVLAYYTLTLRAPFEGSVDHVFTGHVRGAPPRATELNPALPPGVDQAFARVLAKNASDRPGSAAEFVAELAQAAHAGRLRRWRGTEVPRRAALSLTIGSILAAACAWASDTAPLAQLEGMAIDRRFALAPSRPPSGEVVLLVLDEASLDPERPLAAMADDVARGLRLVFAGGARAVAIDLLLPETWRDSAEFADLLATRTAAITLAAFARPGQPALGTEVLHPLVASSLSADWPRLFGLVNLEEDYDGVVRRGRLSYPVRSGEEQPSWAAQAVATLKGSAPLAIADPPPDGSGERGHFWLDHTIDAARFPVISWRSLEEALRRPGAVAGKLVLFGAELAGGGDRHRVPGKVRASGVIIQAITVETILRGFPVRSTPPAVGVALAFLAAAGSAALTLLLARPLRAAAFVLLAMLVYVGVSVALFRGLGTLTPLAAPLAAAVLATGTAALLRLLLTAHPSKLGARA